MELALANLMVLGIFVGIPAVIGFTIAGMFILADHQPYKAERGKALETKVTKGSQAKAMARERGYVRYGGSSR